MHGRSMYTTTPPKILLMFDTLVSIFRFLYENFNKQIFSRTPLIVKPVTPIFIPYFLNLCKIFI